MEASLDESNKEEEKCNSCQEIGKKFYSEKNTPDFFTVHTHLNHLKAKNEKKKFLNSLTTRVSALRNHNGGVVIVHIEEKEDKNLEQFDECINKDFNNLIDDGSMFVDVFRRSWLSSLPGFEEATKFIVITVSASDFISTVDFNTKIRNDFQNINPSGLQIYSLLSKTKQTTKPKLRGLPTDALLLHESRNIEHKSLGIFEKLQRGKLDIVDYIWSNLKLKDNITAFTKIDGGGSFYLGVRDTTDNGTKTFKIVGFVIHDVEANEPFQISKTDDKDCTVLLRLNRQKFVFDILRKVKEELISLPTNGTFTNTSSDLVKVKFHQIDKSHHPERFILEVAVGQYDGIVFYDKGPRSYSIGSGGEEGTMVCKRMDIAVWLSRFKNSCIACKEKSEEH